MKEREGIPVTGEIDGERASFDGEGNGRRSRSGDQPGGHRSPSGDQPDARRSPVARAPRNARVVAAPPGDTSGPARGRTSRLRTYLQLARVSNLPTVWTNVLAGIALAGAAVRESLAPAGAASQRVETVVAAVPLTTLALLLGAMSLFYTGGMFLNDAFDREIDARERPERPIPSGAIGPRRVFALGFGMLALGWLAVWTHATAAGAGPGAPLAAAALAGAIVAYDAWHKGNPWSPVLMGLCRALVYATAALAGAGALESTGALSTTGALGTAGAPQPLQPPSTLATDGAPASAVALAPSVLAGAAVVWAYVIGLTYVAKQETLERVANLWPLFVLAAPLAYGAPVLASGVDAVAAFVSGAVDAPAFGLATAGASTAVSDTVDPAVIGTAASAFASVAGALLYLALLAWVGSSLARLRGPAPAVGDVVARLIAGISLVDALVIAQAGDPAMALVAALGLPLTLFLQRYVRGT